MIFVAMDQATLPVFDEEQQIRHEFKQIAHGGIELQIVKKRVPLGVVFFIYESRPNVTSDAAALCIKSGNALILRGGKEAFHSNTAIAK